MTDRWKLEVCEQEKKQLKNSVNQYSQEEVNSHEHLVNHFQSLKQVPRRFALHHVVLLEVKIHRTSSTWFPQKERTKSCFIEC